MRKITLLLLPLVLVILFAGCLSNFSTDSTVIEKPDIKVNYCFDNQLNGDETSADCGGTYCSQNCKENTVSKEAAVKVKDTTKYVKITIDSNGKALMITQEFITSPFRKTYGSTSLVPTEFVFHILQGGCNGPEESAGKLTWTAEDDGKYSKTTFSAVTETGNYCLKVSNSDITMGNDNFVCKYVGCNIINGPFELAFVTE